MAAVRGLAVVDEPAIEAGWHFRSDQYSFAKRGVPAITFRAGLDLVTGGVAQGGALVADYNPKRYHQPSDAFDPAWTFAGTAQEATVAYTWARWSRTPAHGPRGTPATSMDSSAPGPNRSVRTDHDAPSAERGRGVD